MMIGKFAALESPSMVDLPPAEVIFGRSSTRNTIQRSVIEAANANMPVLVQGKSSIAKEILDRFIHPQSPRGNGALVKVSCPAIPGSSLESEFFGYGKEASTDTHATKPIWRWPLCGHVDESMGNLVGLGRVF
jgi:two-component system response regulator AtoC